MFAVIFFLEIPFCIPSSQTVPLLYIPLSPHCIVLYDDITALSISFSLTQKVLVIVATSYILLASLARGIVYK